MLLWLMPLILTIGFFYWHFIKPRKYWAERGVKYGNAPITIGDRWKNIIQLESFADFIQRLYTMFPEERYSGLDQMGIPTLLIRDLELIREITVKNFEHFTDHVQMIPIDSDPFWTRNLSLLTGEKWKEMRSTLTPAFTSSKMKAMFVLMSESAEQFVNYFEKADVSTIELRDTFSRFTNDVIATCAFGVQCDSLGERNNEFYRIGRRACDFSRLWTMIKLAIFMIAPKIAKLVGLKLLPKKAHDFFTNIVSESIQMRESKNIIRPDLINLLMEARKVRSNNKANTEFTLLDMTAQAFIFFFGGFDDTSTLMCYLGYELGINPDIQERLRQEVDDTLIECNGKITYEALHDMKYFDMIISETLRKWPPTVVADRQCVPPFTIQPKTPEESPLTLTKDVAIWIPIWGIHRDPDYFPNPERFDPERFSEENKKKIKPYTYMPFGQGPRNCIGLRFALMEAKIVYFKLLAKFQIVAVEKTEVPLKLDKKGFNMNAENGFWLGLKKRVVD